MKKFVEKSTVYEAGKTSIPQSLRNMLGIKEGSTLLWYLEGENIIVVEVSK